MRIILIEILNKYNKFSQAIYAVNLRYVHDTGDVQYQLKKAPLLDSTRFENHFRCIFRSPILDLNRSTN